MENQQSLSAGIDNPLLAFLVYQQSLAILLVTFGGMLLFMVIEQFIPRQMSATVPISRWLTNWFLALINFFGMFWLVSNAGLGGLIQSSLPSIRIAEVLSPLVSIIAFVLAVEFLSYWTHRAFHRFPMLWHIHAVHHMDTELDTTTSQRHHFFEVLVTALLITPVVLLFGLPLWFAALYQVLRLVATQFNHSNLRIPGLIENLLRPLIVTPNFHRVHHSTELTRTNSNYGTVVPWFDYLFGTAYPRAEEEARESGVGLTYLSDRKSARLDRVLLLPLMWKRWKISADA